MEATDLNGLLGGLRNVLVESGSAMEKIKKTLGNEKYAETMAVIQKSNDARNRGDVAEAEAIIKKYLAEEAPIKK